MVISESSRIRGTGHFRGTRFFRAAACWALAAQLIGLPLGLAAADKPAAANAASDPVLKAMQTEIARATTELGKAEQPPYYLSYTVYDQDYVVLVGAYGSLLTNAAGQRRYADVNMRVGKPELDNTHGQSRPSGVNSGSLPLGN
jgi:TldD protein